MPRMHRAATSRTGLSAAVCALATVGALSALLAQSPLDTPLQKRTATGTDISGQRPQQSPDPTEKNVPTWNPTTKSVERPTNPLLDSQVRDAEKTAAQLPDYRHMDAPGAPRPAAGSMKPLAPFGFSYFEPARQLIDARRAYLIGVLSTKLTPRQRTNEPRGRRDERKAREFQDQPPTLEEIDAVASLSDSKKLDLLLRQREGKLTDDEKQRYRLFLESQQADEKDEDTAPVTPDDIDALLAMTDQQKSDILEKQRNGTLTAADQRKYRVFLRQQANKRKDDDSTVQQTDPPANALPNTPAGRTSDSSATNAYRNRKKTAPSVPDLSDQLTDFQKVDLLTKQRRGMLTDDEKQRYRTFLGTDTDVTDEPAPLPEDYGTAPIDRGEGAGDMNAFREVADPLSQIFRNVSASAPANYQLSGGDRITLRYWSPTMEARELKLTVDATGGINVPGAGRFIVRGQTAQQAESALRERLSRLFRGAEVSVTLSELRTIPVTLAGESYYAGTFMVPAVVTALNMIYATGGPNERGSLRAIQVRRNGTLVGTVDFYKFLLTGDQTFDIPLQAGDVIFIPGHLAQARVAGEVQRPAIYELTEHETLADAIRYAGGIKPSGVAQRVQVTTLYPGTARVLKDVDASDAAATRSVAVYDGDSVDVFSVRNTLMNKVTVEGAVDQPGEYALSPGMRVSDLIQRARGLTSDAYPRMAHLYHVNADNTLSLVAVDVEKALALDPAANPVMSRWDRLVVYSRQEVAWTGQRDVSVRGAVRKPGIYYRSDNMRVSDLLMQAGGALPDAYLPRAVLLHQRPDGSYAYDFVDVQRAVQGDSAANPVLQNRDVLALYKPQEAQFTPEHTFDVRGEVVTPGTYPRGDGMRLSDALKLAGGLTPRAGERIVVARSRTPMEAAPLISTVSADNALPAPDTQIEDGDVISIQGRGDYRERPFVVTLNGAVKRPGPVLLRGQKERLTDVIREAGGLNEEAYPEGAEFYRKPELLATVGQKQIAAVINNLSDLLNRAEYNRELAKSDIERLKALGGASRSSAGIAIPGLTAAPDTSVNLAGTPGASALFTRDLVSAPRKLDATELEPKGNVAINVASAMRKPGGDDDIIMVDGDTVTIPEKPTTVQVIGAVVHARAVLFRAGATPQSYIEQAGGYAPDAARGRELVIRVGGGLSPLSKVKTLQPGDVVLVPTQVLAAKISNRSNDFDSLFRSLTSSALVILVAKKVLGL